MKGKRFGDVAEVKKKTTEALSSITKDEFKQCFEKWNKRLDKCITASGACIKGNRRLDKESGRNSRNISRGFKLRRQIVASSRENGEWSTISGILRRPASHYQGELLQSIVPGAPGSRSSFTHETEKVDGRTFVPLSSTLELRDTVNTPSSPFGPPFSPFLLTVCTPPARRN
ncbi:hypothetical protein KM043_016361 [Ampulex compressa]|nr:hypothetical protein KM043_016361 [Ampulex compressa]